MTVPPYIHKKGPGQPLHLYHANGFSNGVYAPLLDRLSEHYDVYAMGNRATWPKAGLPSHKNWQIFADDLIEFIETKVGEPIISVGHSMGASNTVIAANKRPDLFKALVLIEPAMVGLKLATLGKLLPKRILQKSNLYQGTLRKRHRFDNVEEYSQYIRRFKGYQKFPEESFKAFEQHAIRPQKNGDYALVFPKEWEAYNYTMPVYLMNEIKKLGSRFNNIPTVAIKGHSNNLFDDALWDRWQEIQDNALFTEQPDYGHLMPMESPEETYKLIINGLAKLGV